MNPILRGILDKHQRTPASITNPDTPVHKSTAGLQSLFPPPCAKCGRHGALADGSCPFATDEEIIGALAAMVVEEFSTRDAQALVRLLYTEGARIGLELHEALRAPEAL